MPPPPVPEPSSEERSSKKGKGKAVEVDSAAVADSIADDRKRKARGDDGDRFAKKSRGDDVADAAKLGVSEAELGAYFSYQSLNCIAYALRRVVSNEEADDGGSYGKLCGF